MHEVLEPTLHAGWVLSHEGYNLLTESAVESRLAFDHGFFGHARRGPTLNERHKARFKNVIFF
jgi:hypothetical protein